jgi:DNA polymerase-3 subunit delta'
MWEIIGHGVAVETLQRLLAADRMPHALLMTGPAGVGKRTLATALAKALTCTGDDPPCQSCIHCRQIDHGTHPDVVLVTRPEGKDAIAIGQVRELRDSASLRPYQARRKVVIIADAEALTAQAADALLKTLEEPQRQLTLILTAAEPEALPATVVSRCRIISLRPSDTATIVEALSMRGVPNSEAERIGRLARGTVGWALTAVEQPKLVGQQEEAIARLAGIFELDVEGRLQLAEALVADRKDRGAVRRQVELLALLARDLLLVQQGRQPLLVGEAARSRMEELADRLGRRGILAYCGRVRLTMDRIDQNVDPRLALEALLVDLP